MEQRKDWTGIVIGQITVLGLDGVNSNGDRIYKCQCSCGKIVKATSNNLARSKGHGCYDCSRERLRTAKTIHNETDTPLHTRWMHMITRCRNPKDPSYHNYGGRGIKVATEWNEYTNFRKWAIENGYDAELTLDRIDVNGNYEPANCRWASLKEQANNKRNSVLHTINGVSKTLSEWCEVYAANYQLVKLRLRRGMLIEQALTTPKQRPFGFKKGTIHDATKSPEPQAQEGRTQG